MVQRLDVVFVSNLHPSRQHWNQPFEEGQIDAFDHHNIWLAGVARPSIGLPLSARVGSFTVPLGTSTRDQVLVERQGDDRSSMALTEPSRPTASWGWPV